MTAVTKDASQLSEVKQIVKLDSIPAVNALLKSGDWILLNVYKAKGVTDPTFVVGRINDYADIGFVSYAEEFDEI